MPLDTRLALGMQPVEIQDPMVNAMRVSNLQAQQQQNQLAQLKMAEYQRGVQEQEGMRNYLAQNPDTFTNPTKHPDFLGKFPLTGSAVLEKYSKVQKEQADIKHVGAQSDKLAAETLTANLQNFNGLNSPIAAAQAGPEGITQYVTAMYSHPILGPLAQATKPLEQAIKDNVALYATDPNKWVTAHANLTGDQILATLKGTRQNTNLGGISRGETIDYAGRVVPGSQTDTPTTMTPYQQAEIPIQQQNAATSARQAAASERQATVAERRAAVDEAKLNATTEPLSPKEVQAREAKYPQASLAFKTFDAKSDEMIKDLETLKNHKGLSSLTGFIFGRTPSITKEGRAAQVLYDKIMARGGFSELQTMRQSSPTGGALGNVSNQEGQYLRQSYGALGREQSTDDMKKNIDQVITAHKGAKDRVKEAFDLTYEYRQGKKEPTAATPDIDALLEKYK